MRSAADLLGGQPFNAEPTAKRVNTVERAVLGAVPEECNASRVGQVLGDRSNATREKKQRTSPVGSTNDRGAIYGVNVQVSALAVDPSEVLGAVEVAELSNFAGGRDSIDRAERIHPFPTQLDCLVVRYPQGFRSRRLLVHPFSLPDATVTSHNPSIPRSCRMLRLACSLARLHASNAGDWS